MTLAELAARGTVSGLATGPVVNDFSIQVATVNGSGSQTANGQTYNGSVYSTCSLPAPTGSAFTPYDQLTEAQVLGWIWANGVDKFATESAVATQIQNQINPPVVTPPLPWSA